MDLENQITIIYNPQDFNRLCDAIFSALWKDNYQQIDDDQTDGGNDGYLHSEKALYAKHCFKKLPKKDQVSEIVKKAKSDIAKAKDLIKKGLEIEKWVFVTPYKMPNDAWMQIMQEQKTCQFNIRGIGPSHLAGYLLEKKYLISEFPFLQVVDVETKLDILNKNIGSLITDSQVSEMREGDLKVSASQKDQTTKKAERIQDSVKNVVGIPKAKSPHSDDYKKILELYKGSSSAEKITEIKKIIYSSTDQEAILQGILALVSWIRPGKDTSEDMLTLIEIGIGSAQNMKGLDAEAILWAERGLHLSTKFCLMDLEGWGRVEMTNTTGFPVITPDEQTKLVVELKRLNQEFNTAFKTAIDKAMDSKNYVAVARVFSIIGSAAGQRYFYLNSLGVKDRAAFEKRVCKESFMYSKDVVSKANDNQEMVYLLHNFANNLRIFNENDEALGLIENGTKLATKLGMDDMIKELSELKTQIIEDSNSSK